MMRFDSVFRLPVLLLACFIAEASAGGLPRDAEQAIVAVADDWDSSRAWLWTFERTRRGWEATDPDPVPVLLGREGLAWGRGPLFLTPDTRVKKEGDWRTPAGVFEIGKVFGYPDRLPDGAHFPYRQVGPHDAWVDDPGNPYYNRHYVARPGQEPPWFESQRMRLGDAAYKWKIEIRHNADDPVPGLGSAIFFHIRRGPNRVTSGCTTMAEDELVRLIRWMRPDKNPHYVILPRREYAQLQRAWDLPELP